MFANSEHFNEPVTKAMVSRLITVPADAPVASLMEIFNRGMVAIVMDGSEFLGPRDPHRSSQLAAPQALGLMSDKDSEHGFATRVIHGGQRPDPLTGAVMPPIYATSTYVQSSPGVHKGYEYSRTANPTRDALQAAVADLEGGYAGFAFASGMAATATILELLDAGSHIVAMHDLYGGSYRLFENVRKRSAGHDVTFADLTDPAALERAITAQYPHAVGRDADQSAAADSSILSAVAQIARRHRLLSVCDNTFATPSIQRPLEHGFDIVVHSTTKYLNGHSDAVGGAAIVREDEELKERLGYLQNALGGVSSPFDSFLTLRGIKTLALAHAAPLFERPCDCELPRKPREGRARVLPRTCESSAASHWRRSRCTASTAASSRPCCAAISTAHGRSWSAAGSFRSPRAWEESRA